MFRKAGADGLTRSTVERDFPCFWKRVYDMPSTCGSGDLGCHDLSLSLSLSLARTVLIRLEKLAKSEGI